MISLLIETATDRGIVALFKGDKLHYQAVLPFGLQNSKNLFPEIVKAFEVSSLLPSDLNLIITGIGPGSYTGIRVGAMVAKTMSFALKVPLVGVCSLNGFVSEEDGPFASIIDAKIGGAYIQTGLLTKGVVTNLSMPTLYSLDQAVLLLKEIKNLVTPNGKSLKLKFGNLAPLNQWNFIELDPNPSQMACSAFLKYEKGEYSLDGHLDLLYLRKTQAEIERNFSL